MTNDTKYNVLFMRDDTHVRRFRVSPGLMKGLVWGVGLLVLLACLAVYGGIHFWRINAGLASENRTLRQQLAEANIRLERLSNVEKILKSNDPEDMQSLLGTTPDGKGGDAKAKDAGQPAAQASQAVQPQVAMPAAPPPNLVELFSHTDMHQASLDNVQARFSGNGMQLRMDLNNLLADKTLNGRVDIFVLNNSGRMEGVSAPDSDLVFSIQRFKRIQASFDLPKGMERNEVFAVRIVIKGQEGKAIFSETYPLARILSS
ncbi:hypothetical protein dsx2_0560 [Desulfovibrio sp. X2]|uniref:hypothetical protein n=1 Tax=Desulfovibrio sp. X2 TaxID=941449 RepID=UPI000358A7CF|nr:hypothetical protein [Desulfovibrio sp. X2]EPR37628.1 hypothetical protein dsx2_0560 [Desulfovibrio sp. X2]